MHEYARRFGTCLKESCKCLSKLGVYYFTKKESWYPLLEGCIEFKDIRILESIPAKSISRSDEEQPEGFFSDVRSWCVPVE